MSTDAMTDIEQARTELVFNLDALESKLNVPTRMKAAAKDARAKVRSLKENHPAVLAVLAVGTVATVGAVGWLGMRAFIRR